MQCEEYLILCKSFKSERNRKLWLIMQLPLQWGWQAQKAPKLDLKAVSIQFLEVRLLKFGLKVGVGEDLIFRPEYISTTDSLSTLQTASQRVFYAICVLSWLDNSVFMQTCHFGSGVLRPLLWMTQARWIWRIKCRKLHISARVIYFHCKKMSQATGNALRFLGHWTPSRFNEKLKDYSENWYSKAYEIKKVLVCVFKECEGQRKSQMDLAEFPCAKIVVLALNQWRSPHVH